MTWLRWDVGGARNSLYGALGRACGIDKYQAFWHYMATLEGFAEYRPSGDIDGASNDDIETWAGWGGKPERFARAFRARCRDDEGVVRGWHRNAKLVLAQQVARQRAKERMKKIRSRSHECSHEQVTNNVVSNVDGYGYGNELLLTPRVLPNSEYGLSSDQERQNRIGGDAA